MNDDQLGGLPADFWWGAATAAYQIEGAATELGRTPSIWDTFSRVPGAVANGDTGDVACDHVHRYVEDVALMAGLGLTHYRFSVSWTRVLPAVGGPVSQAGLDFYDRLVDCLLAAGIAPAVTLYHWDLPAELDRIGGWTSRRTPEHFGQLATVVGERLGDRVALWSTLNEPWCAAFLGYGSGEHAPGRTDPAEALTAAHHLLLGHGIATARLRETSTAPVSIVLNLAPIRPASADPADQAAARRVDARLARVFLDPLFGRGYPADLIADTEKITDWSFVRGSDLSAIAAPLDALGINYYAPTVVAAGESDPDARVSPPPSAWPGCADVRFPPAGGPVTDLGWPIDATGLTEVLLRVHRDYGDIPLLVTENGAAFADVVAADGSVHDEARVGYLRAHIAAVATAVARGVPVRGYFVWSLLDNFEWAHGYTKRFGIVRVDYPTQRRTAKDSALWYRRQIAAHRARHAVARPAADGTGHPRVAGGAVS